MRVFLCPGCRGPPSACAGIHLLGSLPPRQQRGGVGGLRILSPAERSAGERTRELSGWFGADRLPRHRPRVPTRHRAEPLRQPPSQPRTPDIKHGLLHRERLLQAGRRHSRHPSGRSGCQRGRCQNPGEFPGPHGEEEDKERRARPKGPGPRGTRRSWGRPGRRGRRPQRRLGQD